MRRLSRLALAAVLFLSLAGAARADHHLADVKEAPACPHCGMDRAKFASSRVVVEYDDGSRVGTCSLRCAAVDLANQLDKAPVAIRVGDLDTQALVEAGKASWVLGGSKPGVMTRRAKWAFADRARAEAFVAANGGAIVPFDAAMKAAYEDLWEDGKAIRERRRARRAAPPAAPAAHAH